MSAQHSPVPLTSPGTSSMFVSSLHKFPFVLHPIARAVFTPNENNSSDVHRWYYPEHDLAFDKLHSSQFKYTKLLNPWNWSDAA